MGNIERYLLIFILFIRISSSFEAKANNSDIFESIGSSECIQIDGDTISFLGPLLPGCYDQPDQILVLAQGVLEKMEGHLYKIIQLDDPFKKVFENAFVTAKFTDTIPEGIRRVRMEDLHNCDQLKILAEGDFKAIEKTIVNDKWSIDIPYVKRGSYESSSKLYLTISPEEYYSRNIIATYKGILYLTTYIGPLSQGINMKGKNEIIIRLPYLHSSIFQRIFIDRDLMYITDDRIVWNGKTFKNRR